MIRAVAAVFIKTCEGNYKADCTQDKRKHIPENGQNDKEQEENPDVNRT